MFPSPCHNFGCDEETTPRDEVTAREDGGRWPDKELLFSPAALAPF